MKKRKHIEEAFKDYFGEDWGVELRGFEHCFPDWFDAILQAMDSYGEQQEWAIKQMNTRPTGWICPICSRVENVVPIYELRPFMGGGGINNTHT